MKFEPIFLMAAASLGATAFADPCTADLPSKAGTTFSGVVRYVGDGDSMCVGTTANPADWIEVRIADFDAPELAEAEGPAAKEFLERIAKGKSAACTVVRGRNGKTISYDRVLATCVIGGTSVAELLLAAGAPSGGR